MPIVSEESTLTDLVFILREKVSNRDIEALIEQIAMCLPGATMDADVDKMLQEKDIKIEKSESLEGTITTPSCVLMNDDINIKCEPVTYSSESYRLTDVAMCLPGPSTDADVDKVLQEKDIKVEKSEFIKEETVNTPVLLHDEIDIKCETVTYLPESSNRLTDVNQDQLEENGWNCLQQNKNVRNKPTRSKGRVIATCNVCNKSFKRKSHLDSHLRTHYGEKPFMCGICNKLFSWKSDLAKHLRIHSGEKPHRCESCDKSFSRRDHLVSHSYIHSREKQHLCIVCSKRFSRKDHLQGHMRVHSGEKPHCCIVCNRTFSHKSHMVKHTRDHFEGKLAPSNISVNMCESAYKTELDNSCD